MATEYESTVPAPGQELDDPEHVAAVTEVAQQRQAILQEIKKVIVGQDKVMEELLIALLAPGRRPGDAASPLSVSARSDLRQYRAG